MYIYVFEYFFLIQLLVEKAFAMSGLFTVLGFRYNEIQTRVSRFTSACIAYLVIHAQFVFNQVFSFFFFILEKLLNFHMASYVTLNPLKLDLNTQFLIGPGWLNELGHWI